MKIVFDSIRINQVSVNSGVFPGSNIQINWQSQTKVNSAQGTVIGEMNLLLYNINIVQDNDGIDMPIKTVSGGCSQKEEQKGKSD